MTLAFFDTKPYDHIYFDEELKSAKIKAKFFETKLNADSAPLAKGCDAVCAFVNDDINSDCIDVLANAGVKLIALRCAGYNNVDFKAAQGRIHIVRVPEYSPRAVAEHAIALLLTLNRKIHRAHTRIREGNFTLHGLIGMDLYGKTAAVIGTGRIGRCFAEIAKGFGMKVMACDPYPNSNLGVEYSDLDSIWPQADIISLHCPLTNDTRNMINQQSISQMKDGVYLINTSRGALVDTDALISGLKAGKIGGAGLDVYEEEADYFYEDRSDMVITDDNLLRLITYPNVLVTSHQAFFTHEALSEIARITTASLKAFAAGESLENELCYQCQS